LREKCHQWLSDVELMQIIFLASYTGINPCFTAGKPREAMEKYEHIPFYFHNQKTLRPALEKKKQMREELLY
jgi:hypothetical protein